MAKIEIDKTRDRIQLRSTLFPARRLICESVPGARWARKGEYWSFPLAMATCVRLRRAFRGHELIIGEQLWEWAWNQREIQESILSILASRSVKLDVLPEIAPRLWKATRKRKYQRADIKALAMLRRGVNANQPGLGKTGETIGAILEAQVQGPVLVVAPKLAITDVWAPQLLHWAPDEKVWAALGSRDHRQAAIEEAISTSKKVGRTWLLINQEMLRSSREKYRPPKGRRPAEGSATCAELGYRKRWYAYKALFDLQWSAVVVDECHDALVTRSPKLPDQTITRAGFTLLRVREDGCRYALSGTPWRGKPENYWGTLNWCFPERYASYWRWVDEWFKTTPDGEYSKQIVGVKRKKKKKFYLGDGITMIRRTKAEVAPDLPPKNYVGQPLDPDSTDPNDPTIAIWLDMEPNQARQYRQMEETSAAQLKGGTLTADGVLAEMTRLSQLASSCCRMKETEHDMIVLPTLPSNKFDWLLEVFLAERGIVPLQKGITEYPPDTPKVVIASGFTKLIALFRRVLDKRNIPSLEITGRINHKNRSMARGKFQDVGGPPIMFINTKAGGVAIDLDKADDLVLLDENIDPDVDEQVEDRVHRVSRMHQVNIYRVRSRGTVDMTRAMQKEERYDTTRELKDGARGVAYQRAWKMLEYGR